MRFRIFERTSNIQHRTLNVELRSEEHTSELQSRLHLVCRLLLEKKKRTARDTRFCSLEGRVIGREAWQALLRRPRAISPPPIGVHAASVLRSLEPSPRSAAHCQR